MSNYHMEDLMIQSHRATGTRKPITIIDPAKYHKFFIRLKEAGTIELRVRAFLAVALTGGLRVSEGLSLRVADFNLEEGFYRVRVLKKKKSVVQLREVGGQTQKVRLKTHKVYRECKMHPVAVELLKDYLKTLRLKHFDKVFTFKRNFVHQAMKTLFGPHACAHSMARHSHVSWLIHEKKMADATVACVMEFSPKVVPSYSHVNRKAELEKLYEEIENE